MATLSRGCCLNNTLEFPNSKMLVIVTSDRKGEFIHKGLLPESILRDLRTGNRLVVFGQGSSRGGR